MTKGGRDHVLARAGPATDRVDVREVATPVIHDVTSDDRGSHLRSEIEGTISQGVRMSGVRRGRYVGEEKTHLQHLATAAAINLLRVSDWLDERPHAKTCQSRFERLYRMTA